MLEYLYNEQFISFCDDVFDKLPIPINIVDSKGHVVYINKSFLDFLNLEYEDIIGKLVTEVNPSSQLLITLESKKAELACKHTFSNGKKAIVHRLPIFDNEGQLIGGFGMVLFDNVDGMQKVLEKFKEVDSELKKYKNELANMYKAKYTLDDIAGVSKEVQKSKKRVKKFGMVKSNVLILGESGVGKELFAHSIHNESKIKDKPFISINCAAIPENLVEAELFGYEDGAFTGAKKGGNIGKFQLANGGTLFLDEIAELPMHIQVKLLRVLQEQEVTPIGGKGPIKIDVRVISATSRKLEKMIEEEKFRLDLYYRLNVLSLEIPALRERKEDIPLLANKFLNTFYRETGMYRNIPSNIMSILANHNWTGNVRELKNVIEKICVNADEVNISIADLPSYLVNESVKEKYTINNTGGLSDILDKIEKEIILNMLRECNYNKSEAAKKLKIPRASLYRKIEEYGIEIHM